MLLCIQVFKESTNGGVTLPMSADNEIKIRIMGDFLKIFGEFSWEQYAESISLKELNI